VKAHPTSTGTGIALQLNYGSLQPPSSLLSDSDVCDTSQLTARRGFNSSPSKAMFVDSTRILTAAKLSRKRSLSHPQRASPLLHPPPPIADTDPIAIYLFNESLSHFFRTWPSRQSTSSPRPSLYQQSHLSVLTMASRPLSLTPTAGVPWPQTYERQTGLSSQRCAAHQLAAHREGARGKECGEEGEKFGSRML
jgi:hypothetical protein